MACFPALNRMLLRVSESAKYKPQSAAGEGLLTVLGVVRLVGMVSEVTRSMAD